MKKQDKFFIQVGKEIDKGFKYTGGEFEAYFAWFDSHEISDVIEVSNYIWQKDIEDFVDIMRQAGVKSIAVTNTSTGLMEMLHNLVDYNCTVVGAYKRLNDFNSTFVKGISVRL
jgi:hypothetical protein